MTDYRPHILQLGQFGDWVETAMRDLRRTDQACTHEKIAQVTGFPLTVVRELVRFLDEPVTT